MIKHYGMIIPAEALGKIVTVTFKNGDISTLPAESFNWTDNVEPQYRIVEWEVLPKAERDEYVPPPADIRPLITPPSVSRTPEHIEALELLRTLATDNEHFTIPFKSEAHKRAAELIGLYDAEVIGTLPDGYQMTRKTDREFKQWLKDREAPKCVG